MTKRNPPGRPPGSAEFTVARHIYLDAETSAILDTSARYIMMSKSAYMRRLIRANALRCPRCEQDACACKVSR